MTPMAYDPLEMIRQVLRLRGQAREARDYRQAAVMAWALEAFGPDDFELQQRALRFFEEAVELAQAVNMPEGQAHALVSYIYARPPGTVAQEAGGVAVGLLALCEVARLSADVCEADELMRVLTLPPDHFRKRNAAKNAAGFKAKG